MLSDLGHRHLRGHGLILNAAVPRWRTSEIFVGIPWHQHDRGTQQRLNDRFPLVILFLRLEDQPVDGGEPTVGGKGGGVDSGVDETGSDVDVVGSSPGDDAESPPVGLPVTAPIIR